jgi:SAM-dependent methyltransferase
MTTSIKKINLGGGSEKREGYINIDIVPLPEVDIVADLRQGIPLEDNSVDEMYSSNFLEHVPDTVKIMEEIWRVCKPGAKVMIKVPYFKSTAAFKDPTHCSFFTERTFEYFDRDLIASGKLPEYEVHADFKVEKIIFNYYTRGTRFLPFKVLFRRLFWDIVKTMAIELTVKK